MAGYYDETYNDYEGGYPAYAAWMTKTASTSGTASVYIGVAFDVSPEILVNDSLVHTVPAVSSLVEFTFSVTAGDVIKISVKALESEGSYAYCAVDHCLVP
jgi:hypothetical protein